MSKLRAIIEMNNEFVEDLNKILGTNSAYESAIALKAMLRMSLQNNEDIDISKFDEHISVNFEAIDEE